MSDGSILNDVCTVVVHHRTPDLLRQTVESFRTMYPSVHLLIVDNGSPEQDAQVVRNLAAGRPWETQVLWLERNVFHGPAMHAAIALTERPYVFLLDSDTVTRRGGFLEPMAAALQNDASVYGVGKIGTVNKRGFHAAHGTRILHSPFMMVRRAMYLRLPPFEHHGAPTMRNFAAAAAHGWTLAAYPVEHHIDHLGRGTSGAFGYGLGLRGLWDYVLNKAGL